MHQAAGARALREDEQDQHVPRARRLEVIEGGQTAPAAPLRRTIRITGQPTPPRRQTRSRAANHIQARPDRIALWAVMLGLFLVFMAVATAQAGPA